MKYSEHEQEDIYNILYSIHNDEPFRESKDYISDGLLDSFEMLTLIEKIEDFYGIEFSGEDIIPKNFSNVDAIMDIVYNYKSK